MISFDKFKFYMGLVQEYTEKDDQLSNILETEGFVTYSMKTTGAIVDLLTELMDDKGDWLGYWLWECDSGKNPMEITDSDDNIVPFTTLEEVYEWITVGSKL